MQTLCLCGRHSQGGDWSAKWNMFAFQIHTVKQHSLHLFKTLVMSFNTTSRLPLHPPRVCVCVCVSLLVDNASGHFVLHCTTLPVNFQRNARLTLWKLWTLSKSHYRRWTSKIACHRNSDCLRPQSRKKNLHKQISWVIPCLWKEEWRWGIFEDTRQNKTQLCCCSTQ